MQQSADLHVFSLDGFDHRRERLRVDTICLLVLRTLGKAILKIKDAFF